MCINCTNVQYHLINAPRAGIDGNRALWLWRPYERRVSTRDLIARTN